MKLKRYLISILLVILLLLTFFNINRIVSDRSKVSHSIQEIRDVYNKYSLTFNKKKFPIITVKNVVDTSLNFKTIFKDSTIVIILAKTGCSPCQLRELKNLSALKKQKNTFKIVAILNEDDQFTALKLKKIAKINFPFYYSHDNNITVFNTFKKYPLVCLISKQRVEQALLPIPMDKEYSLKFYNKL